MLQTGVIQLYRVSAPLSNALACGLVGSADVQQLKMLQSRERLYCPGTGQAGVQAQLLQPCAVLRYGEVGRIPKLHAPEWQKSMCRMQITEKFCVEQWDWVGSKEWTFPLLPHCRSTPNVTSTLLQWAACHKYCA